MSLHYLTLQKKPKHGIDELKQRLSDTWDVFLTAALMKPLTSGKHGCVCMRKKAKGHHFKQLRYSDLATQLAHSHFRHTKPVLFRATHTIKRKTT